MQYPRYSREKWAERAETEAKLKRKRAEAEAKRIRDEKESEDFLANLDLSVYEPTSKKVKTETKL